MIYLKLICNQNILVSVVLLVFIFGCNQNSQTPQSTVKKERPEYINQYLDKMEIKIQDDCNVFILFTDRCQSCIDKNIIWIINQLKSENNYFILNQGDKTVESELHPFGKITVDIDDNLSRYGLNHVFNQIYVFKQGTLKHSGKVENYL